MTIMTAVLWDQAILIPMNIIDITWWMTIMTAVLRVTTFGRARYMRTLLHACVC